MTAREEVLALLSGSPELHQYLLTHPEKLRTADYADIVAGAPIRLTQKLRLLLNLPVLRDSGRVMLTMRREIGSILL